MKITDKERIEILEKAKGHVESKKDGFICHAIDRELRKRGRSFLLHPQRNNRVFRVFPELKKHKPKGVFLGEPWYNGEVDEDIARRLKVLDSGITEIKAKSK